MFDTIFHTIRHLRPVQVYRRLYRPKPAVRACPRVDLRPADGSWRRSLPRPCPLVGPNRFRFLNEEHEITSWSDAGIPRLWLYNLHYFDCPDSGLMQRWIRENPVGSKPGWEPYPLSLRIVNWIKYALNGHRLERATLDHLALQAEYLLRSVEYHILANHLFANAKALTTAGMFFCGPAPGRWLKTGLGIISEQIPEQILADGGHFERSPMYHALVLEDLLDLINMSCVFPHLCGDTAGCWAEVAGRMLGWLANMTHPDGEHSFFNDAAFGISPRYTELVAYARSLDIAPHSIALGASGYVRLEVPDAVLLFDAAPVGPDYQPGHAHADTLSFELSAGRRRLLVNSGTSTYEPGKRRSEERATAAHNTVRIDGLNSTEVWSSFRVARRARPFDVQTDGHTWAEAAHDGYLHLADPAVHRRRIELHPKCAVITDDIGASRKHRVELFFHVHPGAPVRIELDGRLSRTSERTTWRPQFNQELPNETITGRWEGRCPVRFSTLIHF